MHRRSIAMFVPALAAAAGMIAAMALPVSPASSASGRARLAGNPAEGVPAFGHVFLIIGENTTYSHLSSANAPFLMGTIRPHAAWLSNYYAATHWSQANYVALVTGQFTGASNTTAAPPAIRTSATCPPAGPGWTDLEGVAGGTANATARFCGPPGAFTTN